jgi:hypothetical protein
MVTATIMGTRALVRVIAVDDFSTVWPATFAGDTAVSILFPLSVRGPLVDEPYIFTGLGQAAGHAAADCSRA